MTIEQPLIYLTTGEPSGDQLGAHLMRALREATGSKVRFAGVGGERMAAEGLDSLFHMGEISFMGIDFVPHLLNVLRRIGETVDDIERLKPAALVTIDAQGFSKQVGKRLRARLDMPIIHYVAPTVWAYRPGRARKVAGYLDRLLAIFPFEPPLFEAHGLETTFVGHPASEAGGLRPDGDALRRSLGIDPGATVICALPGSRKAELKRLGPLFHQVLSRLTDQIDGLHCLTPTVADIAAQVDDMAAGWPCPATVLREPHQKYQAFAGADVALATSGTVAVEAGFAGLPTVVVYKTVPFGFAFIRILRILKLKYVSGVNLVLGREAMPEFLQSRARPAAVSKAIIRLLQDPAAQRTMSADLEEACRLFQPGGELPSNVAAQAILDEIGRFPNGRRATGQNAGPNSGHKE